MYPLEGQAQPAILIHSPRTGRDVATSCRAAVSGENFNLLSPYGKRLSARCQAFPQTHFNFLSPYGKRPRAGGDRAVAPHISIPSPRMGIDEAIHAGGPGSDFNPLFPYGKRPGAAVQGLTITIFQSTLPIREETCVIASVCLSTGISIHSSHTGRDPSVRGVVTASKDFNPLFPYGKRRFGPPNQCLGGLFQSTLPIREETLCTDYAAYT